MMNPVDAARNDVVCYDTYEYEQEEDVAIVIAPATAVFFKAEERDEAFFTTVTFTPYDGDLTPNDDYIRGGERNLNRIVIELCEDGVMRDRAYVRPDEGKNCTKFSINKNTPKIFIPKNNKDYAIASTEGAKVMPLCFTTKESGIYTLNFNTKKMNYSYLHLIDNATGMDIDMLQTPSYTFDSKDCGYATRFKLVFVEDATNEIAESFAYVSNGQLMINNNGNATLQVMDITGRILSTDDIQNSYSKSLNLSAGVYVVRLSNGNDVKTQKIVVE